MILNCISNQSNPKLYIEYQNPGSYGFLDIVTTMFSHCNTGKVESGITQSDIYKFSAQNLIKSFNIHSMQTIRILGLSGSLDILLRFCFFFCYDAKPEKIHTCFRILWNSLKSQSGRTHTDPKLYTKYTRKSPS